MHHIEQTDRFAKRSLSLNAQCTAGCLLRSRHPAAHSAIGAGAGFPRGDVLPRRCRTSRLVARRPACENCTRGVHARRPWSLTPLAYASWALGEQVELRLSMCVVVIGQKKKHGGRGIGSAGAALQRIAARRTTEREPPTGWSPQTFGEAQSAAPTASTRVRAVSPRDFPHDCNKNGGRSEMAMSAQSLRAHGSAAQRRSCLHRWRSQQLCTSVHRQECRDKSETRAFFRFS